MKKFDIHIEEVISQTFKVEGENLDDAIERAIKLYKDGKLVVEPSAPITRQICGDDAEKNILTEWIEF